MKRSFSLALLTALSLVPHVPSIAGDNPKPQPPIKWDETDLGPFQTGTYKVNDTFSAKGIAIAVGTKEMPVTMLFDPELLRIHAVWKGSLAEFPRGRGGLDGQLVPGGSPKLSSGWVVGIGEVKDDPRPNHQGNLPNTKWRGLYLNGNQTVLNYVVGKQPVLEVPTSEFLEGVVVFKRKFKIGAGSEIKEILVAETSGMAKDEAGITIVENEGRVTGAVLQGAPAGAKLLLKDGKRLVVVLPALTAPASFQIAFATTGQDANEAMKKALSVKSELTDLSALIQPGAARWGAALETQGKLGKDDAAYVADEITLPDDNSYKSWIRPGGHDFFPDGSAAVVSVSGDVWLVSGLDEKLEHIKWKRFATGLFQPLGCKIVDGKIYVTCRDQITRLHDLNNDGEADFYENFNNDCVVTDNYHEFALDLQTDSEGNFYYGKGSPWTPTNTTPHQGTMLKVSKDGSKLEIFATGLRAPNGLGMGPGNVLSCSDNQGHWMPANRINIVKKGGFYGMVSAGHREMTFKRPDGTQFKANPSSEEDRKKFDTEFWGKVESPIPTEHDLPMIWLPMHLDNSPGGEVWVPEGNKWGPWAGHMLHMSYGKCSLIGVMTEKVNGVEQAAVVRFPLSFPSGIQRGRFSPKDGQLYMTGLNVWQSNASKDGCFSRVRYTGKPVTMPIGFVTKANGVEVQFSGPLDAADAGDAQAWNYEQWGYKWTGNYGSQDFSAKDPNRNGKDTIEVKKAVVSADKKSVFLELANFGPAMQGLLKFNVKAADGTDVDYEIYNTTHQIPGQKTAAAK